MIEKIGSVKNPLTIIAIFAGIAEVSGTTVLPFITAQNQGIFIYFLIIFPIVLIILFFLTLNFNNKALYAPSDFSDEENYIKIFRYDISKQQSIEITVSQDTLLKKLNQEVLDLKRDRDETLTYLEGKLKTLNSLESESLSDSADNYTDKLVYVSNFYNANKFIHKVIKLGYAAEIFIDPDSSYADIALPENYRAIWLGETVSIRQAKDIIKLALNEFPFLQYIKVNEDFEPDEDYIYIGGATTAVLRYKLKPLSKLQFNQLQTFETIEELHSFINTFK